MTGLFLVVGTEGLSYSLSPGQKTMLQMPRVGWQPCNNLDNQNDSKVTNSITCLGRD